MKEKKRRGKKEEEEGVSRKEADENEGEEDEEEEGKEKYMIRVQDCKRCSSRQGCIEKKSWVQMTQNRSVLCCLGVC